MQDVKLLTADVLEDTQENKTKLGITFLLRMVGLIRT